MEEGSATIRVRQVRCLPALEPKVLSLRTFLSFILWVPHSPRPSLILKQGDHGGESLDVAT